MLQVALKLGALTETDTGALADTILTSLPNAVGVTPDPTLPALTSGASVSIRVHTEGVRGLSGAPEIAGPKIVRCCARRR